jgi:Mce-associated membrane protein
MNGADEQRTDQPGTRPSPGPGAASRARRIGGRPTPGSSRAAPRPVPAEPEPPAVEPEVAAPRSVAPVRERERNRPDSPGRLAWLPAGLLAVLVAVLLGFGVAASHGVWWAEAHVDVQHQRTEVLAAAKTCMATMNTYDYRKLDAAEKSGLACTTGKLTDQYRTAMDKLIKPQAAKVQFTQTAQVNSAGIESISKDGSQWTVLIFGQLSTTNSQTGSNAPKLSIFSARVTMQRSNGHWLVANYEYAPAV